MSTVFFGSPMTSIDLTGLPDPIVEAVVQYVQNIRRCYSLEVRNADHPRQESQRMENSPPLPSEEGRLVRAINGV